LAEAKKRAEDEISSRNIGIGLREKSDAEKICKGGHHLLKNQINRTKVLSSVKLIMEDGSRKPLIADIGLGAIYLG
jgi:hypothetical protein